MFEGAFYWHEMAQRGRHALRGRSAMNVLLPRIRALEVYGFEGATLTPDESESLDVLAKMT